MAIKFVGVIKKKELRAAVPLVMASCTFKSIMTPAKSDLGYRVPISTYKVLISGTLV